MQYRHIALWPFTARAGLSPLTLLSLILPMVVSSSLFAQDINNGRALYITPLVAGQFGCSNGQCHGPSPANNQNKIQSAADDPGRISLAISRVAQMAFLKNNVTGQQLADLAAYIGDPGGVTGTPTAILAPSSLSFPAIVVGSSATSQQFAINNTGTAALIVSSVTSSNTEFSLVSSCGTIAAGASCNVSVGFTPNDAGNRSGTITVNHNASGATSTLPVSGTATAATAPGVQVSTSTLVFGAVTVGSFSPSQNVTVFSVGTAPLVISSLSDTGAAFQLIGGTCAVGVPVAVGTSCTIIFRFSPAAVGTFDSVLNIAHNAGTSLVAVALNGEGVVGNSTKTIVEYRYVPLNYFFITSRDADKVLLDGIADFQRTGLSFPVYATQFAGTKAITRFYFDQIALSSSRGSHFYTLLDNEKAALVALNPANVSAPRLPVDEGIDSWAFLPAVPGVGGSCASGLTPVYRVFRGNARFPDDPNHRFTVSLSVYHSFVALGWDGEGVSFCVPQPKVAAASKATTPVNFLRSSPH